MSARIPMKSDDPSTTVRQLAALKTEHRELDATIARLVLDPGNDELELKRLKKRKLHLKDSIALLESSLIPDLDA
ncbi:YdcH family protein [Dokdonella sp.]|uniref:YdcH family protein n=1 Tax=Dokdonella sp. TaxID=2291710 RepID=UPI003C6EF7D3